MTFFDYDQFDSNIDIGMRIDINEFFSCIEEIEKYEMHIDSKNTLKVYAKCKDPHFFQKKFIYEFLQFIAYSEFCVVSKEKKDVCVQYNIYTANEDYGTRIILELH